MLDAHRLLDHIVVHTILLVPKQHSREPPPSSSVLLFLSFVLSFTSVEPISSYQDKPDIFQLISFHLASSVFPGHEP